MKTILSLAFAIMMIVTAGCGSDTIKVSGKITLEDDTPVVGANVFFVSGITQGRGTTNADGVYSLSFKKTNDGIPAGSYQVLVVGAFFTPDNVVIRDDMDTGSRPMIDYVYAVTETTPLTCEVPNAKGYDFVVEPSDFYKRMRRSQSP